MTIKPCPNPVCEAEGDDPRLATYDLGGNVSAFRFVECPACGMTGPRCATKREATADWNGLPRVSTEA